MIDIAYLCAFVLILAQRYAIMLIFAHYQADKTQRRGRMLKKTRQSEIRRLVDERGHITVTELNRLLDVSEATIRRDLEQMANRGWVQRTHGGAIKVEPAGSEPPIKQRLRKNAAEKERIGKLAASLVREGETIFLGSGSTVREMTPHLLNIPNLTVITNSLPIVNQLANSEIELIIIGGMLRQSELSMVGHVAEQAIREFRADHVFIGITAIDVRHGLTGDYLPEAITDRTILGIAPHCVIVADHSKFGRVNSVFLAPVTAVHTVVTDSEASPEIVAELKREGVELLLA
jgi:DeoR/GlpR family transcriptional regulator of sugar metabolism